MIYILVLLLIFIILVFKKLKYEYFNFQAGLKKGFGNVLDVVPSCQFSNNCFPGYYFRSQEYNICNNKIKLI